MAELVQSQDGRKRETRTRLLLARHTVLIPFSLFAGQFLTMPGSEVTTILLGRTTPLLCSGARNGLEMRNPRRAHHDLSRIESSRAPDHSRSQYPVQWTMFSEEQYLGGTVNGLSESARGL